MKGFVTAVLAVIATTAPAHAAQRPDLKVTKLSAASGVLQPGATVAVKDAVRNVGRAKAKRSTVTYWLSADRRRNRGDVPAGRRTQKALKGRRTGRGKKTLKLATTLPSGAYHLIACADGTRKVKERREGNNCRATRGRLTVTAPALPNLPAPAAPAAPVTPPAPTDPPPSDPDPAPMPGTGADDRFPDQAPDPLTVTHTLETENAQTRRLGIGGGTIKTTAKDGTIYTLTVPYGALVGDEDITMTPVASVGGPLSGPLIGAVELLPHGLELLQPATLTIDPAGDAGEVHEQTGFLSHDQGEDFHLYPLSADGGLQMQLTHFSTPGISQATEADRQVVLAHPPERYRAQYEQMMEAVIREARVNPEEGLPADEIAAILRGYYNDIVHPLVEQAYTDDTKATAALSELLSWLRQVQLLELQGHPRLKVIHDAHPDMIIAIVENAIEKGYERCVQDHDLDFIVRLIGYARMAALLGLGLDAAALDKAQRCANFEVDFDSRITQDQTIDGDTQDHRTTAVWNVQALDLKIDMSGIGTGALTWKSFSYLQTSTYPCSDGGVLTYETRGTATRPDESITMFLGMDLNPREPGTPPPADRDIRLRMFNYDDIGETYQQTATSWCGDQPATFDPVDEERWRGHYDSFHVDEYLTGFQNWTMGTGDLIATKSYSRSWPNNTGGYTEETTVELWHKPLT